MPDVIELSAWDTLPNQGTSMLADAQAPRQDNHLAFDSSEVLQSRLVCDSPESLRSSLRRVVNDYVAGWGIVLSQTPKTRRRKMRLWDRRALKRWAFRRPVWVHKARWGETSAVGAKSVMVQRREEMSLVHDLSDSGIGLSSDTLPKSRLVVLEFDSWAGQPVELLVQLRWRRCLGPQNYRCGGTILGVLTRQS